MTEYLVNPRRTPRAPIRCQTTVVSAYGTFEATTEDIGGHGCQLVSPRLVRRGEPVQVVISHEAARHPLRVAGRVAWASDRQPWRLGIAYDDAALSQTKKWFEDLLAHVPGMALSKRIPDQISVDAPVFLAAVPRFLVDFTPDEVVLLRSIGSGITVGELRALLRDRWPQAQRALFSLLAHQHLTLTRGASVHPDAWRKILSEAEASLAIESLQGGSVTAPSLPIPPSHVPAPGRGASGSITSTRPAMPAVSPPLAASPAIPVDPASDPASDWLVPAADMMPSWQAPAPHPAHTPAAEPRGVHRGLDEGASWASTPPPVAAQAPGKGARPAEAQACYERALAALKAGSAGQAMVLLRRALALAPGDAEIAGALGRAMRG